jgi:hypothetical protein
VSGTLQPGLNSLLTIAQDNFDSSSTYPFPSPTAPAPGPSLLDDNESRFLDSFFDGVSSDQFDYNLFGNAPGEAEAGFGWNELPPTFMGTTSSYGQQPQIGAQDVPNMFSGLPSQLHTNPPGILPSTSADVLEAAALLQNGSAGRSHSMADGAMYQAQQLNLQPTNGHMRPHSMSQFSPSQPYGASHQRQSSDDYMRDNYYTSMVFGHPVETTLRQRNTNQKMDIRWGSDASFGTPQGFMAPGNQHADAKVERAQINSLETALKLESVDGNHADSSQTTSPISAFRPSQRKSNTQQDDETEDTRPRKRRKSKFQNEPDDEDEISTSQLPGLRKRKPTKKDKEAAAESESGHKRRKSTAVASSSSAAAAASKASRENLTEDQKRENHIRSEQKRRTLIREGFEDLGELVPGLRGGGFSKSAVLVMAGDWLEDLVRGNEVLRAECERLEGRGG